MKDTDTHSAGRWGNCWQLAGLHPTSAKRCVSSRVFETVDVTHMPQASEVSRLVRTGAADNAAAWNEHVRRYSTRWPDVKRFIAPVYQMAAPFLRTSKVATAECTAGGIVADA
jgi:hypothetical protein